MAFELKRFWKEVSIDETEAGFAILLDQRPLKTPLKNPLAVPTFGLAERIQDEWQNVEGKVDKQNMPFTRIAESALDGAATEYAEIVANLAGYGETDLLCYRAETPVALIERQATHWDPLLEWAAQSLNAPLQQTHGIIAIDQSKSSIENLRQQIEKFDLFQLTAFYDLVKLSGSLIIAFAVARGYLSPKTGWQASRVDELWQIEQWGSDDEAERVAAIKLKTFETAHQVLVLLE